MVSGTGGDVRPAWVIVSCTLPVSMACVLGFTYKGTAATTVPSACTRMAVFVAVKPMPSENVTATGVFVETFDVLSANGERAVTLAEETELIFGDANCGRGVGPSEPPPQLVSTRTTSVRMTSFVADLIVVFPQDVSGCRAS
jgi:hypothetical protein